MEWPLRLLALVAALAVVAAVYRRRGLSGQRARGGAAFGRAYWLVVLVEVVALFAGLRVLAGPLDQPEAAVTGRVAVVGIHFFALAVVFDAPFFHVLGAAITACGALGLVLVFAGVGQAAVDTISGVLPGLLLLAFASWGVRRSPRSVAATVRPTFVSTA